MLQVFSFLRLVNIVLIITNTLQELVIFRRPSPYLSCLVHTYDHARTGSVKGIGFRGFYQRFRSFDTAAE